MASFLAMPPAPLLAPLRLMAPSIPQIAPKEATWLTLGNPAFNSCLNQFIFDLVVINFSLKLN